jgi:hypothetical protein
MATDGPRLAVLIAPFRTETVEERHFREKATAALLKRGWCPIFVPLALADVLDDGDPEQRACALRCSDAFLRTVALDPDAAIIVLGCRRTEGMELDLATWWDAGGKTAFYVEDRQSPLPSARGPLTADA